MPGKRAPGQTFIGLPIDAELLKEVDAKRGSMSRSAFIRQAIYDELVRTGTILSKEIVNPPDRAGKGGRPKKIAKIESYMAAEEPPEEVKKSKPKPRNKP